MDTWSRAIDLNIIVSKEIFFSFNSNICCSVDHPKIELTMHCIEMIFQELSILSCLKTIRFYVIYTPFCCVLAPIVSFFLIQLKSIWSLVKQLSCTIVLGLRLIFFFVKQLWSIISFMKWDSPSIQSPQTPKSRLGPDLHQLLNLRVIAPQFIVLVVAFSEKCFLCLLWP